MHIAIVEDNMVLAGSIEKVLRHEGYATTHFSRGDEALLSLTENRKAFDLVILDVLLPGMNGFDVCRTLRSKGVAIPILLLTSKGTTEDTVTGLDCGADDYLKKPFEFDELLARIRSLSRRQPQVQEAEIRINEDIVVDMLGQRVFKEGNEVHLTAKEFGILSYFLANPNRVLTQQELYDHVFDYAEVQLSNTIEVHVKNLRKKLKSSCTFPLSTIKNAGYRFDYEK